MGHLTQGTAMSEDKAKKVIISLSYEEHMVIKTAATMQRVTTHDYIKSRILALAIKDVETFSDLLKVLKNNETKK